MSAKPSDYVKYQIIDAVQEYFELQQQEKPKSKKINYAGRVYNEDELLNLVDAALDFWLTAGHYTNEFEKLLSKYLNIKYCHLVNSGSSANLLAFMALTSPLLKDRRIKRGDEVITIACCFPTTVSPIVQYGAIPVFVDIDLDSVNVDIRALPYALSSSTKAIMLAHTLGNPVNLKTIQDFCDKYDLWLIEDNCDSLGSQYNQKYTGTFGHIGTSSFYPPHHITMGEGGAVYTNHPDLSKILLSLRDWGRDCYCNPGQDNRCKQRFNKSFGTLPLGYDHKYVYSHFGYNLKATDLQAAIGCAQMQKLDIFTKSRKENYAYLRQELDCLSEFFSFQDALPESDPSWFGFLITLTDTCTFKRNDITEYLENNGVQTRNLFAGNITRHPCFESLVPFKDYRVIGRLENTDKIMHNSFWIGTYSGLKREDLDHIIMLLKSYTQRSM